jgi:hypothetical protein
MDIGSISTSLQGLQANAERFNGAAQQISAIGQAGDVVDIAAAFVSMSTAELGMEASIMMIKAENEMQRQIIDMFV